MVFRAHFVREIDQFGITWIQNGWVRCVTDIESARDAENRGCWIEADNESINRPKFRWSAFFENITDFMSTLIKLLCVITQFARFGSHLAICAIHHQQSAINRQHVADIASLIIKTSSIAEMSMTVKLQEYSTKWLSTFGKFSRINAGDELAMLMHEEFRCACRISEMWFFL